MRQLAVARFFEAAFDHAPERIAEAPGRIEFIGNHLDYNGGLVLGAAVDRSVHVALRKSPDGMVRLRSATGFPGVDVRLANVMPQQGDAAWANYPLGMLHLLRMSGLNVSTGFELAVASTVPSGAGLSSSAALELATAVALVDTFQGSFDRAELARLARRAENEFVGMPCGILDQGVVAFGRAGHLVLVDAEHETFTPTPLPDSTVFWVFNTHQQHALVDSLYAERHHECRAARDALEVSHPELKHLAALSPDQIEAHKNDLTDVQYRRAMHVTTEQARVEACQEALERGDLEEVGRLLLASHASSRDLFENSTAELDFLVEVLAAQPGVYGARLTGGGFGGAVMALTTATYDGADEVAARYQDRFGQPLDVLPCATADGARILPGEGERETG